MKARKNKARKYQLRKYKYFFDVSNALLSQKAFYVIIYATTRVKAIQMYDEVFGGATAIFYSLEEFQAYSEARGFKGVCCLGTC